MAQNNKNFFWTSRLSVFKCATCNICEREAGRGGEIKGATAPTNALGVTSRGRKEPTSVSQFLPQR